MRVLGSDKLVIASHNHGKLREIADLVAPLGLEVRSAAELGLPEPEEPGESFAENARIKALAAARGSGLPALADDSGLCVRALRGDPGVRSARWAGPAKDFELAMRRVQEALGESEDRSAAFFCALCLAWPDGHSEIFQGEIAGTLVWPPRGDRGFGYDAMFLPEGWEETFGEVEPARKHAVSHRARAFALLLAALEQAHP